MGEIHGADPPGPARGSFPMTRCHGRFSTNMRTSAKVPCFALVDCPRPWVVYAAMDHGAAQCG